MIGLIIPPSDIKKFVEKTAEHVAINGSEFENLLLQREQHKNYFSFLQKESPYRAYYDHRVAYISKKLIQYAQGILPGLVPELKIYEYIAKVESFDPVPVVDQQYSFLGHVFEYLKEPDPYKYIAELPYNMNESEYAIIQHTAQYVARNGKNFQIALSEREKNNPQFEFLKPSSDRYKYFTKLVDGYTNVLALKQYDLSILLQLSQNKYYIFAKCRSAYYFQLAKLKQSKGKKYQTEGKRYNNIDWNDYELVETIAFEGDLMKNIRSYLTSKLQQHAILVPKSMYEKVISEPRNRYILQQCHVCRLNILASYMNKHLKSCLGQKKKQINDTKQNDGSNEVDIRHNLYNLTIKRPDIFGTQENEIVRKGYPQEDKVIWDGQDPNITRATASTAMLINERNKKLQ